MCELMFNYIRLSGRKLNPESFGGREPRYEEVYRLYSSKQIMVERRNYVAIEIKRTIATSLKGVKEKKKEFKETIWISEETYNYAKMVLGSEKVYYVAHEGVSFDVAKGAWRIVGKPSPVKCPPGYREVCVLIETKLSRKLGMEPFIVEQKFVFKGISGEHIKKGKIDGHVYLVLTYDREKKGFLTDEELSKTLLYKNYLSKAEVKKILMGASKHMRKEWWYVERMREEVLAQYKVVWRDVAKEFVPAIDTEGAVPDHNVHYVATNTLEEAYYLMAVLLAPQINAVVQELSPWVGHVQPRFLRYFKIPKYSPSNPVHRKLADIGKRIHQKKHVDSIDLKNIESLIERL